MSNITISNNVDTAVQGTLILTDYGRQRVLERVANLSSFTPITISKIVIGDKMRKSYTSSILEVGNPVATYEVTSDMISISGTTCIIKADLELEGEVVMQEIGLYETVNKKTRLFAYASGFSMIKSEDLSFNLIVDLELQIGFDNQHYSQYGISLGDTEYAKLPLIDSLYSTITDVQLDLERAIQSNTLKLGYNTPEVLYKEQLSLMQMLQNSLMFSRYQKIVQTLDSSSMTDCFYYPETDETSYYIRNLQDSSSQMKVTGDLQVCNRDNIDFSGPATIILTATIDSMDETGMIIGKCNPSLDMYYVDFRIMSDDVEDTSSTRYFQFTIYSYDISKEYDVTKGKESEFELVGHYRIKYEPSEEIRAEILGNEAMYTFIYNGDTGNPNVDFYINTHKIEDVIEDVFNFSAPEDMEDENSYVTKDTLEYFRNPKYSGPCSAYRSKTTLRNYLQTSSVANYEDVPYYYVLSTVTITSFFAFNDVISENDITYLALINQS